MTEQTNPAPLCGDTSPGYPCVRGVDHHGHHRDKFGNRAVLRYLDDAGDVWESADETGRLVQAVGIVVEHEREAMEATRGLTRVATRRVTEVPEPAAPVLPDTVYVVTAYPGSDPARGVYLSRDDATAAAYAIAGEGSYIDDVVLPLRAWTRDDRLAASVRAMPLHAPHGLPVVDQAAVTAALDGPGLPVDVMHADADGPGIQASYRYGEDDHSDAEPAGLDGGAA